ncbi:PKD domain protein [Ostertagia ostertagi]
MQPRLPPIRCTAGMLHQEMRMGPILPAVVPTEPASPQRWQRVIVTVNQLATVPPCVTNATPVAGATLSTQNTATLTWPAAAGATSYDVYLAAGAGTPTTLVGNTTSLSYSASGLTANTLYSWYIAPRNAVGAATTCAAANTTTFTTAVALPGCVINTSPAAGTTLASQTSVTLTWPAAAGATSYDVYLAAGTGTPTTLVTNTTALTYTSSSLTAGTTYSWYIAPRNAGGAATSCGASNTTTFTTAAPTAAPSCVINTSPAAGTTLASQTSVTLTWPAAANATSYDVYLAAGTGIPTTLVTNTTALTYTSSSLTAGTTYSWYIAPRNAVGVATGCGASNTTTFSTASVPACVTNSLPVNGSVLPTQTSARLSWPASAGAVSYDVYLATGSGVPTVLVTNTTALTYYATTLTANTLYSWYVAPRNANGANTACGSTNRTSFTTAVATGGGNISPVSNAGSNTSITLPVTSVTLDGTGAVSYDVYLATGSGVPTVLVTNTTALTYYATTLTANTLYSWYVAPRNANGANTACGSTNRTSFTTAVATGGGNISPVSNAGSNTSITLPVTSVTLDGSLSYDPDGRIAEFYWYQIQGPFTISTPFSMTPTVTGLSTAGNYIVGLQVKDNNGVTAYSQVTITVNAAGARIADANTLVAQPVNAQLNVSGSVVATLSSTISPNPVKPGQSARLQITSDKTGTATVNIINSNGFIVSQQRLNLVKGINNTMRKPAQFSYRYPQDRIDKGRRSFPGPLL